MRNSIFDLEIGRSTYTRVNTVSIPRLELQAAVLASRLAKTIQEESRTEFEAVKFFTDSTITLAWIQNPSLHVGEKFKVTLTLGNGDKSCRYF